MDKYYLNKLINNNMNIILGKWSELGEERKVVVFENSTKILIKNEKNKVCINDEMLMELFKKFEEHLYKANERRLIKKCELYTKFTCILIGIKILEKDIIIECVYKKTTKILIRILKALKCLKMFECLYSKEFDREVIESCIELIGRYGFEKDLLNLSLKVFKYKMDVRKDEISILEYILQDMNQNIECEKLKTEIKKWKNVNLIQLERAIYNFYIFSEMGIDVLEECNCRKGKVDFHIHTNRSDGKFRAKHIVEASNFLGLEVIAITDHATMEAIEEAQLYSKIYGITVVPGVEISTCIGERKIHVLGYGKSLYCKEFKYELKKIREKWNKRFFDILIKLDKKYGISINRNEFSQMFEKKNMYSIEDISEYLFKKGYGKSKEEIIKVYFDNKMENEKSAYITSGSEYLYDTAEAIKLIKEYGGISIIAHPSKKKIMKKMKKEIEKLKKYGLDGIEVSHPTFSLEEKNEWSDYGKKNGFLLFGGSDFHYASHRNKSSIGIGNIETKNVNVSYAYYLKNILKIEGITIVEKECSNSDLSIEEKIGLIVRPGFLWTGNTEEQEYAEKFRLNIGRIDKSKVNTIDKLIEQTQKIISTNSLPTLININQEGGRLNTLDWEGMNIYPGNMALGRVGDEELIFKIGYAMGEELRALGITWNLAPVGDVLSNHENTSIGTRSFNMNQNITGRFMGKFILGLQKAGVAATAKHFIGLGKSTIDSHEEIPVIDKINDEDIVPFKYAIKNNVASIMIGNIIIENWDAIKPAFMSKAIIEEILRKKLKYEGVIVTENISIPSLIKQYKDIGEVAVLAFEAGVDIILFDSDFAKEKDNEILIQKSIENMLIKKRCIYDSLFYAVKQGRISIERLDKSIERILKMINEYGIKEWKEVNKDIYVEKVVKNKELLIETTKKSVSILLNKKNILPLNIDRSDFILIIRREYEKVTRADSSWQIRCNLYDYIKKIHKNTFNIIIKNISEIDSNLLNKVKIIIFISYNANLSFNGEKKQIDLINELTEQKKKIIVVGTGDFFEINQLEKIEAYISALDIHSESMKVVSELIFNKLHGG